jgi:hypothetical protein
MEAFHPSGDSMDGELMFFSQFVGGFFLLGTPVDINE